MPKRTRVGDHYLLAPGEWLPGKERFRIQGFLGQGNFAAAYRAANEADEVCFIKEYFPPQRPSQAAELLRVYATERDVVRRIGNHELIPRFWDAFHFEGYHYIVTDYVPGPDLEQVLQSGKKPEIDVMVRWSVCLCQELAFLHSRNVVHHDLKPANLRLNADGDPVMVDFSAAHWYRNPGETTEQLYGSDSFLAPEYAERSVEDADSGKRMDVFALGRILVELIVGERLSQEDINRRSDQLYGQILHSGQLDVSFVRAVFKAVAYDPQRRYGSGVEMMEDITPAAPPAGRVRPAQVDFGLAEDTVPREVSLQCYNAGGGTLRGEIAVEGDWIEIGTSGAITGRTAMFERNRQSVRVVAYPERVPPGFDGAGRVVFGFQNSSLQVPVRLRRASQTSQIQAQPSAVRINVPPGAFGQSRLTFTNQGAAPAAIRVIPPVELVVGVQPEEFTLAPHGRQEVTVSVDSSVLGDLEANTELRWTVDGNPRPNIPLNAAVRRGSGLLSALSGRLRKK